VKKKKKGKEQKFMKQTKNPQTPKNLKLIQKPGQVEVVFIFIFIIRYTSLQNNFFQDTKHMQLLLRHCMYR